MKSVAVLIDGGFAVKKLRSKLGRMPTADDMCVFAAACLRKHEEELFRIYYYDCPPYDRLLQNPLSREKIRFGQTRQARQMRGFLDALGRKDHVALRRGTLTFVGWKLGKQARRNLMAHPRPIEPSDLVPDFKQKRVDIKIGLDVAWLASRRIVDRIVLVTADSDFVPAMKFARREGVQIVLVTLGHRAVDAALIEHSDECRAVEWPGEEAENEELSS